MGNFIGIGPKFKLTKGLTCKIESIDDRKNKSIITVIITKIFPKHGDIEELYLSKATVGSRRYASFRNEIKSIQFG